MAAPRCTSNVDPLSPPSPLGVCPSPPGGQARASALCLGIAAFKSLGAVGGSTSHMKTSSCGICTCSMCRPVSAHSGWPSCAGRSDSVLCGHSAMMGERCVATLSCYVPFSSPSATDTPAHAALCSLQPPPISYQAIGGSRGVHLPLLVDSDISISVAHIGEDQWNCFCTTKAPAAPVAWPERLRRQTPVSSGQNVLNNARTWVEAADV